MQKRLRITEMLTDNRSRLTGYKLNPAKTTHSICNQNE